MISEWREWVGVIMSGGVGRCESKWVGKRGNELFS